MPIAAPITVVLEGLFRIRRKYEDWRFQWRRRRYQAKVDRDLRDLAVQVDRIIAEALRKEGWQIHE